MGVDRPVHENRGGHRLWEAPALAAGSTNVPFKLGS